MSRLASASRNTGGARKLLRVDTVSIQVSSGSGGTNGLSGPRGSPIGPGTTAGPRAPAAHPKIPRRPPTASVGSADGRSGRQRQEHDEDPDRRDEPGEATHAAGTSSGQSPPAAITDRSYSPPAKVTPASTPATRRSQPIRFSGRRVVRIAPTRPRFAGRSKKTRKNGITAGRPGAAPPPSRARAGRARGRRSTTGRVSRRGRDGTWVRAQESGRTCDQGRKRPEPVFTRPASHEIVPGVLRRRRLANEWFGAARRHTLVSTPPWPCR